MRLAIAFLVSLLAACSRSEPPQYRVGSQEPVPGSKSESTYIRTVNAKQHNTEDAPLDSPIRVIEAPMPDYPGSLRVLGIEGFVVVAFAVETDGSVAEATVEESAHPELAQISVETVRRWKFEPPKRNGQPTRLWLKQPFNFALQ
jgi:TonB family protein